MNLGDRKIAVFHGDYSGIVEALITCGKYDAVFHGHTHQRINQHYGKTLSLNPGSLMKETSDSIAFYDTSTNLATYFLL